MVCWIGVDIKLSFVHYTTQVLSSIWKSPKLWTVVNCVGKCSESLINLLNVLNILNLIKILSLLNLLKVPTILDVLAVLTAKTDNSIKLEKVPKLPKAKCLQETEVFLNKAQTFLGDHISAGQVKTGTF